jgi:GntR family transcriptional repressor for pyruvate dehydrogenase complex
MPEPAPRSTIPIVRLHVPKASGVLAEHLRESILSGEFTDGVQLPSERELAEGSGLSRSSVREALRILEAEGLIVTRPGRNGGATVKRPTRESIERSVNLFIRGHRIRFRSLLETREAIEPAVARLAALNRTEQDLALLRDAQKRLESAPDLAAYRLANVDWHLAVTTASHNELLISFMNAISQAIHAGTTIETLASDEVRVATIRAHERIYVAIRDGDPDAAARRMARHVMAYSEHVKRFGPADLDFDSPAPA